MRGPRANKLILDEDSGGQSLIKAQSLTVNKEAKRFTNMFQLRIALLA